MLGLSLSLGVLSAVAYGSSTAVQHGVAHTGQRREPARGLLALLRSLRWWMSLGGDGLGLVLQIAALATGPVVLIQPLQVLSLPVALPLRARFGGPAPSRRDWVAVAAIIVGLAGFLLLVGDPGRARLLPAPASATLAASSLAAAAVVMLAARLASVAMRAVIFGSVSGGLFAVVAVLIDVTSQALARDGWGALDDPRGLVPLVGVLVVGAAAMTITQLGFQLGHLGASFPALLATDPLIAVLLGVGLLGERIPLDLAHLAGYLVALVAVVAATVGLANPQRAPVPPQMHPIGGK